MISDAELHTLKTSCPSTLQHFSFFRQYFSLLLERPMTIEETSDAIDRLSGPPDPDAMTYKDIERRVE